MAAPKRKRRETFGQLDKRASGRYRARYADPTGAVTDTGRPVLYSAPHTFTTLTDARAWLAAERAKIERGEWESPDDAKARQEAADALKFYAYAIEHIDTRVNSRGDRLKPSTRANYRLLLEGPLKQFHDVPLHKITPADVRKWNSAQLETGHKTQTARAYLLLKSVLATAVADGHIAANPCQIKGAAKASTGKRIEPPTDAELHIITATIDPRLTLMVEVAAWGGLRWGELTELRRGDLTFQGDTVVLAIARAVTYTKADGFTIGPPKSVAGIRDVALPHTLTAPLRAHLATLDPRDETLLFPAMKDPTEHFNAGSFSKFWRAAREAAGRPDMPFHALRHYGLTRYAMAGATTRELLDRAGHNDITTALRYQHAAGRDAELAARMIDAVPPTTRSEQ